MATIAVHTNPRPNSAPAVQSTPVSRRSTIQSLDGLRGFAILLVLWCHYDEFLRGPAGANTISAGVRLFAWIAGSGVQLFFVLSGFLLFLPYARALVAPEQYAWPRALSFYQRRIRRIVPAYLTVFVTIIGLMLIASARQHALAQFPWPQLIPGLFLLYDFRSSTFTLLAGHNPILGGLWFDAPLWSLTVEWQFYLLLPLLAWGLSRLGSVRRIVGALLLLMICGLVVRGGIMGLHYAYGIATPTDAPGLLGLMCMLLYGINGKFLEVFALGMLASLFYVWAVEQQHWKPARQRTLALTLLPLSTLGFIVCGLWWALGLGYTVVWPMLQPRDFLKFSWDVAGSGWAYGLCATALLLTVLCLPHSIGKVFSLRPLTFVGMISYSLYLWHWPAAYVDLYYGVWLPPIVVLCLVLVGSTALYYRVERPFLHYRRQQ